MQIIIYISFIDIKHADVQYSVKTKVGISTSVIIFEHRIYISSTYY